MPLQIVTIPCRTDNYAFLLHDADSGETALVDAPEAAPIINALDDLGWSLTQIIITHSHYDHIDGVEELRRKYGAKVIGCKADAHRLPPLDIAVTEGDMIDVGTSTGRVLDVSGHCDDHLAFYFADSQAVFTADSLMALGCGRLFEGTPAQMWDSLSKIAALPADTIVYSGHEYTTANAIFAYSVEPNNAALRTRIQQTIDARAKDIPTVPSTLSDELETNPFLRPASAEIRKNLKMNANTDAEVFAEIRRLKDNFNQTEMPDFIK